MKMTFLLLLAMSANNVSNAGIIDWSKNKISNAYSWTKDHKKTIAFTGTTLALIAAYVFSQYYNVFINQNTYDDMLISCIHECHGVVREGRCDLDKLMSSYFWLKDHNAPPKTYFRIGHQDAFFYVIDCVRGLREQRALFKKWVDSSLTGNR
jgi:hypothetical protein